MLDLVNTVQIEVNWNNLKSIELAELQKANLENDGWTQVNSFGGITTSALVYAKEIS